MAGLPSFPWMAPREPVPWCRTALARDASLQGAVDGVVRQLAGAAEADLALVFASASFASDLPRLLPLLRQKIQARHWLGCLGGGVVGTEADGTARELEEEPALSVTLLRLPGATLQPFAIDTAALPDLDGPAEPWRALLGGEAETAPPDGEAPGPQPSLLVLVDPATAGLNDLISGLDYAYPQAVKVGGVAASHSARHGSLLFEAEVRGGAVGCLIGGRWRIEPLLAQGCRPIGPVFEVEQAQRNVVIQVSRGDERRSPVEALQTILSDLSPSEREQVRDSLFLGVARNDFSLSGSGGRTPFLVRNLIGVDPRNGAVAVGEPMRVGQKVQFQLRDGEASRLESRQLLADCAAEEPAPLAALLFACLGRGQGLYGAPDGDVSLCREAFATVPIAGVFCNGEIGPLGGATHLHGYTASWGFLVPVR
ncbi:MAG: FIST N-terminal domain-containing protein [Synechococcaceae cyanobacterium]|nr:FIST N-terminal domain-containing protein [Synechococcaceae cyanobacterium]